MGRKLGGVTRELRKICVVGGLVIDPPLQLSLAARRIVAYLVIKGHPVSRQVAAAELWPDVIESAARANLRRALWRLPPGWVTCVGDDLTLEVECDLAEANRASNLALNGEPLTLEQIQLLSQDILPGWLDDWILLAHEGFRLLRVQALEAACRTMISRGAFALATQAAAAAFAAEPLRESAAEALIDAHLAQHNRYQAVQCFRELAKRLSLELGVDPDPSLVERLSGLSLQL